MIAPINRNGFTLIEIIAVLIILGIAAVMATAPLTNMVSGFILAKDASEMEQKSLLALSRIQKELNLLSAVDPSSDSTNLHFYPTADTTRSTSTQPYSIHIDSNVTPPVVKFSDGSAEYALIDNVNSLTFTYYDINGNQITTNLDTARKITTTLSLSGVVQTFTTTAALTY